MGEDAIDVLVIEWKLQGVDVVKYDLHYVCLQTLEWRNYVHISFVIIYIWLFALPSAWASGALGILIIIIIIIVIIIIIIIIIDVVDI